VIILSTCFENIHNDILIDCGYIAHGHMLM